MTTASGRPVYPVPAGGLPARAVPDAAASAVAHLDPGLIIEVVERRGDWANIICSNGWSAWVDARSLMGVDAPTRIVDAGAPTETLPQQHVSSGYATASTSGQQPATGSVWWKSRRLRLVVSLMLCVASPVIYILGS